MAKSRKTTLLIEVTAKEWRAQYTGSFKTPTGKDQFKHDARLMSALISSPELFAFFNRVLTPVIRCKRREARKKAQAPEPGIAPLSSAGN